MSDSNKKQGLIKYYIAREACVCYNKKLLFFALAMLKKFSRPFSLWSHTVEYVV